MADKDMPEESKPPVISAVFPFSKSITDTTWYTRSVLKIAASLKEVPLGVSAMDFNIDGAVNGYVPP